jgi:hypothetical protein
MSNDPMAGDMQSPIEVAEPEAPAHTIPWRTGRHRIDRPGPRGRTLYDAEGEMIGVMDTSELAARVVAAVNARESLP